MTADAVIGFLLLVYMYLFIFLLFARLVLLLAVFKINLKQNWVLELLEVRGLLFRSDECIKRRCAALFRLDPNFQPLCKTGSPYFSFPKRGQWKNLPIYFIITFLLLLLLLFI